jgi:hypothetical protein
MVPVNVFKYICSDVSCVSNPSLVGMSLSNSCMDIFK